ncbi:fibronectin type III domain-containing protein [Streptomyces sp. NPDC056161]|uniref:fibronectin type III domain-containing protein n=1 Tax=Streptomyces sp. NPDC056161 TaxID=3345732 RepID=UPI0035D706A2
MRRVSVPHVLALAALALVSACGWGSSSDNGGERPPGAPTGVTAEAGSATSVHVMWNAVPSEPGIDSYEVYRDSTRVAEVPGSERMVDVTRLRPSTTYAFTVRARDTEGRLSADSRQVRAKTPAAVAADRSAPSRPAEPTGRAVGSRAVQLSWDAAKDDRAVVSYDVYQGTAKIHSVGGNQTATVVGGLRPGTRYTFTVRARDAADNLSPASSAVRLTTPGTDDGRATAPTGFRVTSRLTDGAYYLDLSWDPPADDGVVTEYQIQLDRGQPTSLVWGGTPPKGRATYSFYVGREAGADHRVRIRARLSDGTWGGYSAERSVTTGAGSGATP